MYPSISLETISERIKNVISINNSFNLINILLVSVRIDLWPVNCWTVKYYSNVLNCIKLNLSFSLTGSMASEHSDNRHAHQIDIPNPINDKPNHGNESTIVNLSSEIRSQMPQHFIQPRLQIHRNSVIVAPSLSLAFESPIHSIVRHVANTVNDLRTIDLMKSKWNN